MESLKNKTALVTGASRGIGRGIALALADAGVNIAVNYHKSKNEAEKICNLIEEKGCKALAVQADVSEVSQVKTLIETIERELGEIDILINNAGIAKPQKPQEISIEDFDEIIKGNLRSSFLVTQAVLPKMRKKKWGRIIMMSSVAAQTGGKVGLHYAASKAGQLGMMRNYSAHLAPEGITVNAVAPALIETDMVAQLNVNSDILPVKRLGTVEEVADATLMLLRNGYITGHTLNINGGMFPS